MKLTAAQVLLIHSRYRYDPDLVHEYGTPLWDTKAARPIKPITTVRVGTKVLTPKVIVYVLCRRPFNGEPATLPKYILSRDEDQSNILIDNLVAAKDNRRWAGRRVHVESDSGVLVPREFIPHLSEAQREELGIRPELLDE